MVTLPSLVLWTERYVLEEDIAIELMKMMEFLFPL